MVKQNAVIRAEAKRCKVMFWQIAEEIGVVDCVFSKMLRKEFDATRTEEVIAAIHRLAKANLDE